MCFIVAAVSCSIASPLWKAKSKAAPPPSPMRRLLSFCGSAISARSSACRKPKSAASKKPISTGGAKKTGYAINVKRLTVRNGHAYDIDSTMLERFSNVQDRRTGLRAASDFIQFMKRRQPGDGAIYIHDDIGKDRTGVVCAAYELWRNRGTADADTLWDQVMNRYLVSNTVIDRDKEAARIAGGKTDCGFGENPNYVCSGWLAAIRPQLEIIAQL